MLDCSSFGGGESVLFNSYEFLFAFLPLTVAGFFLAARFAGQRAALWFMAFASFVFYGWWSWSFVPLLLFSIAVNFGVSRAILPAEEPKRRKLFLILGVAFNLALLGYFKYANFFVDSVNALTGADFFLRHIVLPIGISFFTFTQIAYLADAYQRKAGEYDFGRYCVFVSYFPHLVAGPILHHREMMPQFADPAIYRPKADNFAVGLTIFVIGLLKKLAIADQIAEFAQAPFAAAESGSGLTFASAWQGALAYTLQIYFDFSGYSDMAIGLSLLFGVKLPLNFNSPYKAGNIVEFWRRWHMTLSRFLRDYLYIPLGGNRKGTARRYLNLMATMLLGGLWHGAGWTFVVWGGLHGVYLSINHAWIALLGHSLHNRIRTILLYRFFAWALTFFAVVIAWVFFRAQSFDGAMAMLGAMSGAEGYGGKITAEFAVMAALFFGIAWLVPNTQQILRKFLDRDYWTIAEPSGIAARWTWRPNPALAALGGAAFAYCIFLLGQTSEFLYFQF